MRSSRIADHHRSRLGGQQVDLVPDLQDRPRLHIQPKARQNLADVSGLGGAFGAGDVADMDDDVRLLDLFQGGPDGLDQLVRQVRDESDRVGEDRRAAVRKLQHSQGRVEGCEQHVLRHHVGLGQAIEQGRLAGVGVAHQRHGRVRMALAGGALQGPRASHLDQFAFQLADFLGQQAPVGLDLGFARTAHDPEAAPLTFQVGPGPDQPRAFIGQPGQLDLKPSLPRPGAPGEDLEDQSGSVDDLGLPGLFQVALLDRRKGVIDDDDIALTELHQIADLLDLAPTKQGPRRQLAQVDNQRLSDFEIQRQSQTHGLLEAGVRVSRTPPSLTIRMDDDRALGRSLPVDQGRQTASSSAGS